LPSVAFKPATAAGVRALARIYAKNLFVIPEEPTESEMPLVFLNALIQERNARADSEELAEEELEYYKLLI
jgi:hypothetical protein